ncbi:MAG: EAL domain-containing protein [Acetivibrionales bacterium]
MMDVPLIFSIIFSLICIVSLYLGIYTLYTNPVSRTNRLFFALASALFIWSFGFAMAISAADISSCLFWRRFAAIGWGVFFSILLHFIISLTDRDSLLDRWWKYILLYLPAAVCLSVFTYIPGLNPQQFNLVKTPMGWVNISIKNYWDWFFIAYYLGYTSTGIYLVRKWGKSENSRNVKKQANIIIRCFLSALVLGVFTESIVNNVFSIRIPQLAPIVMMLPVLGISYAMQKYGFLDTKRNVADSLLFSDQIRIKIVHYLASYLFIASVLNVIALYFIYRGKDLFSVLLFSGILIIAGIIFEIIERIEKSKRYKDFVYAVVFFVLIPVLTLNYIEFAVMTVWAHTFIFLIISIAMVSRVIQTAVAASILLTHIMVFILKPTLETRIDEADHIGRIGLSAIAIWIAFFIMNVFRTKLLENAYQISFQELVAEISTHYISVGEKGFDQVTSETLRRTSEFLMTDGIFIYLLNEEKDKITCSYSWTNGQNSTDANFKEIVLSDYPYLKRMFSTANSLEIYDIDDLPPNEYDDIVHITDGQVKSLLILPIENNDNVYGYLMLQSIKKNMAWGTIDKNNLMIISNIIAGTIERIEQEKQINFMAYYDTLTGLPNRTLFRDRLNRCVLLAERRSEIIAVIFMDLDSFKNVNDTLGHEGGDELIIEVARKLSAALRKSDTVSRFGGDEFLIMVNNIENTDDVYKVADKVISTFRTHFSVRNQEIYISASIGIAVYPFDGSDADTLIRNADIAMYQAKARGKGQYCLCTEDMKQEVVLKHELSNKLYRAIDNNELSLHYQPLVSASTGEILCMEALVRWNQPDYGLVDPGVFIPLAEQNGLIIRIGEWVLRTACSQAVSWHNMGSPEMHVSVNVSVLQLRSPSFVAVVEKILNETGLDGKYLDLEITESAAVRESDNILGVLEELRDLGIEISIDDFGTGYSSLSRLNHMPVNRIKIDRSFINNLFRSEKDQTLVNGMIHLSQTLGIKVVAEGVEHKAQLDFLRRNGCDEIQGFYISRPIRADEVVELLNRRSGFEGK